MSGDLATVKAILVGDTQVGKSCIMIRFVENSFRDHQSTTIGVDFGTRVLNIEGTNVKVHIWDTAGQEKFKSITRSFYRGAAIAFVVLDVTARKSFENVQAWLQDVLTYGDRPVVVLVSNKTDLDRREVTSEEVSILASCYGFSHVEVSARTGVNVDHAFAMAVARVLQAARENPNDVQRGVYIPARATSFGMKSPMLHRCCGA